MRRHERISRRKKRQKLEREKRRARLDALAFKRFSEGALGVEPPPFEAYADKRVPQWDLEMPSVKGMTSMFFGGVFKEKS